MRCWSLAIAAFLEWEEWINLAIAVGAVVTFLALWLIHNPGADGERKTRWTAVNFVPALTE